MLYILVRNVGYELKNSQQMNFKTMNTNIVPTIKFTINKCCENQLKLNINNIVL